ncbi:MAG TPA: 50S ribosomal protein L35 [Myxococcaceae bacterium]|nr:50S ribosomal protein L35 [Myxococcaceae bacterium]
MPKLKTRSGAKKRFQVSKTGQVKHDKAFGRHLFTFSKTPGSKRTNRGRSFLKRMDAKKVVQELFPYGAHK